MSYEFKGAIGPWQAVNSEDSCLIHVGRVDERGIMPSAVCSLHGEREADMIAAAPELFEACAEFVRKVEAGEAKSTRSYRQMKAALAKATGGEG